MQPLRNFVTAIHVQCSIQNATTNTVEKDELRLNGSSQQFLADFKELKKVIYTMKEELATHLAESVIVDKLHTSETVNVDRRVDGIVSWMKVLIGGVFTLSGAIVGLIVIIV